MWGLSLKYDFERQLQTRSATCTMNSLVAGFCSLFASKSFFIKAWNLPPSASNVSLSRLGQLFDDPLQVSAVSKKPNIIDNFARFGSAFASSTLKTSTTDEMSFKGKQLASVSILARSVVYPCMVYSSCEGDKRLLDLATSVRESTAVKYLAKSSKPRSHGVQA